MGTKMHKVIPEKVPSFSEEKKIKIYPTFRLGDDDLPMLDEMEVGKKYQLVMEVEVMSKSQGSEWNQNEKDKSIRGTFKVLKVGCEKPKKEYKNFEEEMADRTRKGHGSRFSK